MRIATLTHDEAANPAVMANVAKYLLSLADHIHHLDRPDTGAVVEGSNTPADKGPGTHADKGATPVPLAQPSPEAVFAPSFVAAAAAPIAPAVITPPLPQPVLAPAPVPVPVAAAPVAPAAPASPAPSVDVAGLPWDERIHARTKALNKDGTWRQKRETPAELVSAVEAELRARVGLPVAPVPVAPPAPVVPPGVPNSVFALGAVAAPVVAPPAPVAPVAPVTPAPGPATFQDLMVWVTPHMTSQALPAVTVEQLHAVMAQHGVVGFPALIADPTKVPLVAESLRAQYGLP
jgi:hypothetical protein